MPKTETHVGRCSIFGGPHDSGMTPTEPIAIYDAVAQHPELFLPHATLASGRSLNPAAYYVAMRWDYKITSRGWLRTHQVTVSHDCADGHTRTFAAWPADWGPNARTERIADLSPGLAAALGVQTDGVVTVLVPVPGPAGEAHADQAA
jgi:hypothetical protein